MQDATLNANAGKYAGMDRFVARKKLWADLEADGLAIKKDDYTLRCGAESVGGCVGEVS